MPKWLPWALIPVAAVLTWAYAPPAPPTYRMVEVPVTVIEEVERVDTVVTFVERIVWREREPVTVAIADSGAVGLVDSFCQPSLASGAEPPDPVRPLLLLRSVTTNPSWFGPTTVTFTGPLSTGDLKQFQYRLHNGWRAHVRGDGLLVQEKRLWWLDDVLKVGLVFGAGYLAGSL